MPSKCKIKEEEQMTATKEGLFFLLFFFFYLDGHFEQEDHSENVVGHTQKDSLLWKD